MSTPKEFIFVKRPLKIAALRKHPGIFVSDFLILRSLQSPAGKVQRHVKLRRGLNILWADPAPADSVEQKKKRKASGHTAGKSTFCRLIRYALGEKNAVNPTLKSKISANLKLRESWVVLRVEVNGKPWLVGRAITDAGHHFAVESGDLDALLAGDITASRGYKDFLDTLKGEFVDELDCGKFPGEKTDNIEWTDLLPWYTRDQEARLLSIITWRGLIAERDSISADQKHFLMRLVLGLLPKGEIDAYDAHEKHNEEKKRLSAEKPLLNAKSEQAFLQLAGWVENTGTPLESDMLLASVKELQRQKEETLKGLKDSIPTDEQMTDAWERAEESRARLVEAKSTLAATTARLKDLRLDLGKRGAEKTETESRIDDLYRKPPANVCGVPLKEACPRGQLLAAQRSSRADFDSLLDAVVKRIAGCKEDIGLAEIDEKAARKGVKEAQADSDSATKAHLSLDQKRRQLWQQYYALKAEVEVRAKVIAAADTAHTNYEANQEKLKNNAAEIQKEAKAQEEHRAEKSRDLSDFSELYQHILEHLLGEDVIGGVGFHGRALEVSANNRNDNTDLESGAITAAKLVSFDLAALAWSMEGHGAHPRFLIHDSPREADMAADIYEGLFNAALELESAFSPGTEPNFQYIVTTTAPPPDALKKSPWLLTPTLNALIAEKRILGVNL